MTYTPGQIESIEKLAGLNYTFKQIAMYLDVSFKDLLQEYEDKESAFRYHYDRGKLMSQAEVDKGMLDSAKGGNITAIQQFEKVRQSRHFENIRDQLIYGN
jgi:hypothetical protein